MSWRIRHSNHVPVRAHGCGPCLIRTDIFAAKGRGLNRLDQRTERSVGSYGKTLVLGAAFLYYIRTARYCLIPYATCNTIYLRDIVYHYSHLERRGSLEDINTTSSAPIHCSTLHHSRQHDLHGLPNTFNGTYLALERLQRALEDCPQHHLKHQSMLLAGNLRTFPT